jgi:hypothetical protein
MTDPRTPRTEAGRTRAALITVLEDHNYLSTARRCDCDGWAQGDGGYFTDHLADAILEASTLGSSERLAAAIRAADHVDPGIFGMVDISDPAADDAARAILAADPALFALPDAERQRAIGEAVERLPKGEDWSLHYFARRAGSPADGGRYQAGLDWRGGMSGTGQHATIEAAIAAALPAAQEPER